MTLNSQAGLAIMVGAMPTDGAAPTKPQIERQLIRMLENETFTSRPQLARLLDFIVRSALADIDVTEKSIRDELFPTPPYKEESNIARRTIDLLRKSLAEYYTENLGDVLVVIYLPEQPPGKRIKFQAGEAYKPHFAYNIYHQVSKDYLLGCHYLQSGYLNQIPDAVELFRKVLEREPEHAGAMLNIAEAFCFTVFCGILPESRESLIAAAGSFVDRATSYAPEFWHTHSVRALVHYFRNEFDAVQPEFEKALKLDREQTESSSFYSIFLVASGRASDALQLTEFVADEQIDNPVAHVIHGLHLARARRYDEAESAFRRALELDRNSVMAHVGAVRLNMARGRMLQAQQHAERLKLLLEPEEYEYWMANIKALYDAG